ncbi:DUF3107 domain-containing protein [Acidipropionibacterium jensenii]|uniref:DUF3107 domain-containing protein n=1 Tax=Acidipropionibacterium jensenii TaxID=1749 RepID=UPI00214B2439|nr:DUF3107 domain-containing protein [Acidipropionibacterium jensenii]
MEIKIGISDIPREVAIESDEDADVIEADLRESLSKSDGLFKVTDAKGRTVLVPTRSLAYLDLGQPNQRQVGFGRA